MTTLNEILDRQSREKYATDAGVLMHKKMQQAKQYIGKL
jgi:hypothetical protein